MCLRVATALIFSLNPKPQTLNPGWEPGVMAPLMARPLHEIPRFQEHVSHSLNGSRGDTRSLDDGSCGDL